MPKRSRNGVVSRPCRVVGADQREGRQVDPHAARRRPLADDDVERAVLHRRIEHFLDHRIEPVDLVDEEYIVWLEIGQQRGKVARLGDHPGPLVARKPTPSSFATICARVVLPRPGGPKNNTWSIASPAARGGLDEHAQILARGLLTDELGERFGPQRCVGVLRLPLGRMEGDGSGHMPRKCHQKSERKRQKAEQPNPTPPFTRYSVPIFL